MSAHRVHGSQPRVLRALETLFLELALGPGVVRSLRERTTTPAPITAEAGLVVRNLVSDHRTIRRAGNRAAKTDKASWRGAAWD